MDSSSDSDSDVSDFDGFMGPLSRLWFTLDTNSDGQISKVDIAQAFKKWNHDAEGGVSREEFFKSTDGTFLEMCFEAAVMSDSDQDCLKPGEEPPPVHTTDSEGDDDKEVVKRRRRCSREKHRRSVWAFRKREAKRLGVDLKPWMTGDMRKQRKPKPPGRRLRPKHDGEGDADMESLYGVIQDK